MQGTQVPWYPGTVIKCLISRVLQIERRADQVWEGGG